MKRIFGFRFRTLQRVFISGALLTSLLVFIQTPVAKAEISYADAGTQFQATNLTSATMETMNFDSVPIVSNATTQTITFPNNVGTFARPAGSTVPAYSIFDFNADGGAGGTGRFITAGDILLTLNTTHRYVGFWWSAGNSPNNVTINLVGGGTEVFDAGTISSALGGCPNRTINGVTSANPYCNNPNTAVPGRMTNELYAYVHIRNETGFNSVRFSGAGFEFDNVSVSQTIPERVSTESTFSSATVRTTCASVTSTDATNNTRACPRTITISSGTASQYNPLLESQISGYTYPNTVSVTNSDVNSGVGSETRNGNVISLSSNTVGTFTVNFTITNSATGGTDTSRITVIVETVTARIPSILYIDPQENSKKIPIPSITGGTNLTLCTSEVSDNSGNALAGSNTVEVTRSSNTSGVTRTSGTNLVTYAGTQANINTQLSTLSVQGLSNAVVVNGASKFLRIVATPTSSGVNNQCATGVSQIIELKPLELGKTRLVDVAVS
jgi:hypothetical protein